MHPSRPRGFIRGGPGGGRGRGPGGGRGGRGGGDIGGRGGGAGDGRGALGRSGFRPPRGHSQPTAVKHQMQPPSRPPLLQNPSQTWQPHHSWVSK